MCNTQVCNYDAIGNGASDCECLNESNGLCGAVKLADTTCQPECNIAECGYDNGACLCLAAGCTKTVKDQYDLCLSLR